MVRGAETLTWHKNSFQISPIGYGRELKVSESDLNDDGCVVYEKNGVKTPIAANQ
jgi:hypothetical protein